MRVNLIPWQHEHAVQFSAAVLASLDTLKPWLLWANAEFDAAAAQRWFDTTHTLRSHGLAEEFGIFADDGRLLGGAGLRFPQKLETLPSIGYWVRSSEQGKGVATAAVKHLLALAFADSHFEKVEILAGEENIASRKVAVNCGAELIAIRYGLIVLDSGPISTAVYHISRPEKS